MDKSPNPLTNSDELPDLNELRDWEGVDFVVGAAHGTTVNVAMQFVDKVGNDIAHSVAGQFYLSDDAAGLVFTSSGPGANTFALISLSVKKLSPAVLAFACSTNNLVSKFVSAFACRSFSPMLFLICLAIASEFFPVRRPSTTAFLTAPS